MSSVFICINILLNLVTPVVGKLENRNAFKPYTVYVHVSHQHVYIEVQNQLFMLSRSQMYI